VSHELHDRSDIETGTQACSAKRATKSVKAPLRFIEAGTVRNSLAVPQQVPIGKAAGGWEN